MEYAFGFLVMIYLWHGVLPRLIVDCLALPFLGQPWCVWVYFHCFVFVGSHVSLAWVELLVPRDLVGQTLWSHVIAWVELLVL